VSFEKELPKNAIVIFDSRYGNTEKVAKSLQNGIGEAGIETACFNENEIEIESLKQYALIAIGGPTEAFHASKLMRDFLQKLKDSDFRGHFGFAFDTRFENALSGSAAKTIEKQLKGCGLEIIAPHESAFVIGRQKQEKGGVKLKDGEEKKFEQIGKTIGSTLREKRSNKGILI